jgi:transcription elongation factor GreA
MNQPIFLTQDAFNSLLANLVELEEGIDEITDVFFREPSKEAENLKRVLNEYIQWLDGTIKRVKVDENADNDFPCAVVGSEVVVEDLGSKEIYSYKLVSPLKNKVDINEISFLSPMGKAMLLKKVNDQFVVEAPGGNFDYRIKSVTITASSNPESSGDFERKDSSAQQANLVG